MQDIKYKTEEERKEAWQKEYNKEYYQLNKEKIKKQNRAFNRSEEGQEYNKKYFQLNKEKRRKGQVAYRATEKGKEVQRTYKISEKGKETVAKYRKTEKGKETRRKSNRTIASKLRNKRFRDSEKGKAWKADYRASEHGKEVLRKSARKTTKKLLSTPEGRLSFAIRGYLRRILKEENLKKSRRLYVFLGCSMKELRQHLESQFIEGMSWNNYGQKGWHVDHIIPIDYFRKNFDYSDIEVQKKCWNYKNLRPYWVEDNLKKGNKLI